MRPRISIRGSVCANFRANQFLCTSISVANDFRVCWFAHPSISAFVDFRVRRFQCPFISVSVDFYVRWFLCPSIAVSVDFRVCWFPSPLITKSVDSLMFEGCCLRCEARQILHIYFILLVSFLLQIFCAVLCKYIFYAWYYISGGIWFKGPEG